MVNLQDCYDFTAYLASEEHKKLDARPNSKLVLETDKLAQGIKFMQLAYPKKSAYEQELYNAGARYIAGVDEVGRGCLAGPLVAAAVILPADFNCPLELNDSKQLSAKRREKLAQQIQEQAISFSIEEASIEEIAEFNILEADKRAMQRALASLQPQADGLLVDYIALPYKTKYGCLHPAKGDSLSYSIAAASIIAKVYRDKLMDKLALDYPQYDWQHNKGYGTHSHYLALDKYGPCKWHRELFLRKWQAQRQTN